MFVKETLEGQVEVGRTSLKAALMERNDLRDELTIHQARVSGF